MSQTQDSIQRLKLVCTHV